MKVIAIFDIGKTNKKFFIFDKDFNQLEHEYIRFEEIPDDDGFASEDLDKLTEWIFATFDKLLANDKYEVESINFSTYGASLVHLDEEGNRVTPFYNYLKPFPKELEQQFFATMPKVEFETKTASPFLGFLNSGLQLYYLKYAKPEYFSKIKHTLHFPQYLSSLFTKKYVTDYTSVGCHTGLWDFQQGQYADWVRDEGLIELLAPVVPSTYSTPIEIKGHKVKVGAGVHDSSSTLIPYINSTNEPFMLVSTGTWSICMNFFNEASMTSEELKADCLNFLSIRGTSVKASRLLLGKHLSEQAKILSDYYQVDYQSYKNLKWNSSYTTKRTDTKQLLFDHSLIKPERFGYQNSAHPDLSIFDSYEDALLNLFDELTDLQIASLELAIGKSEIRKVYLDGGISSSEVFVTFLTKKLPDFEIYSTSFALGSALGAALLANYRTLSAGFLSNNYKITKHQA
ncbi:MAG: FGGY family carbohydrate kinase [Cyclobacteriaceae bacterium]